MQRPDLDRIGETFIPLPSVSTPGNLLKLYDIVRFQIHPLVSELRDVGIIEWYAFLVHDRFSGVPTTPDDDGLYYHVTLGLAAGVEPERLLYALPAWCVMTRKMAVTMEIQGIDRSALRGDAIEEAWRIIGAQSEWFLDLLDAHKPDREVDYRQVAQFLHYFANMAQLRVR